MNQPEEKTPQALSSPTTTGLDAAERGSHPEQVGNGSGKRQPILQDTPTSYNGPVHRFFSKILDLVEDYIDPLAIIMSTGTFLALGLVLWHYNNRPNPEWHHISLNSIISWLGTLAGLAISTLLASGVSQLKWVRYTKHGGSISSIEAFDAASEAFGAVRMLWNQRAG